MGENLIDEAMKQGAVPEGYKKIEIGWFEFKQVGDTLTGQLVDREYLNMTGGRVGRYTVQDNNGKRTAFLGSIQLDANLKNIQFNTNILVRLTGIQKTAKAGYDMKIFEVWTK